MRRILRVRYDPADEYCVFIEVKEDKTVRSALNGLPDSLREDGLRRKAAIIEARLQDENCLICYKLYWLPEDTKISHLEFRKSKCGEIEFLLCELEMYIPTQSPLGFTFNPTKFKPSKLCDFNFCAYCGASIEPLVVCCPHCDCELGGFVEVI